MPGDSKIEQKQLEKITKYQGLNMEVERLWEKKAMMVVQPVVIGALGAIPRDQDKYLRVLGLNKIKPSQLHLQHYWEQYTFYASTSEMLRSWDSL